MTVRAVSAGPGPDALGAALDGGPRIDMQLGRLRATEARTPEARAEWLAMRARHFRAGLRSDADRFDAAARSVLIRDAEGAPVAGFRLFVHPDAASARQGYVGQFYDLSPLRALAGPFVEYGRVCLAMPGRASAALRLILAVLTHVVEGSGAGLLFGAASFPGRDLERHAAGLAWLAQTHLGPPHLCPRAPGAVAVRPAAPSAEAVPPLLRAYLSSGAFVGPDAVADPDLDTLHVFTALAPALLPEARARVLRTLAAQALAGGKG